MRILVAAWDSGGGVEAVVTVAGKAASRGHQVTVLGTEGLRERFEAVGAIFRTYRYAPDNDLSLPETDLVKDWEARTPIGLFGRVRDRLMFGPASQFCRDVVAELASEPADVLIVDALIPSALSGGEAARVPTVLLMHGPYMLPRDGAPPFGLGLRPARSGVGRLRDRAACAASYAFLRAGMPALNKARSEYGLAPLASARDLEAAPDRILVCSSPSFDFAPGSIPTHARYVGPQLDDRPMGLWADPWLGGPPLPLVLVSLSSTVMRQEQLLQRAADALGELPVHGVITTGPAVDPGLISAPPNVVVQRWARHADILPHCAAVLTHGGHGTVMKALAAGVPLVVVPLGRDQPDNAARVAIAGVGVRVSKSASAARLRAAIRGVLTDDAYGVAAREMALRLEEERKPGLVIEEIERLASLHARVPDSAT